MVTWAEDLKSSDFTYKIEMILRRMGYPEYVWRETLLAELFPEISTKRKQFEYNKKARTYRRMITACMSDPDNLGYQPEGGHDRNPRFKKV